VPSDATIVSGRRVADRYRLVDQRAEGTWTAVDETLRRNVVVHVLPGDAEPHAKEHFTAEARSLARLNHRNIVCTYDTGVDGDGTSYRVDELAGGAALDLDNVDDHLRVPCALQIVRAVSDAHSAGLAHGALGSTSVLLEETGRVQLRGLRLPATGAAHDMQRADLAALVDLIIGLAPPGKAPLRDVAVGWRQHPPTSARAMLDDVAAIPDPTLDTIPPPAPTPTPEVPTTKRRGSGVFAGAVVVVVLAAAAAAVLVPKDRGNGNFTGPATPIHLTAKSFDPQGRDKSEDERDAPNVLDGKAATVWKTDRYNSAQFGNLKDGVGLILQAGAEGEFDSLTIASPSSGWAVEVYVAAQPGASLGDWGRPLAGSNVKGASTTLDLKAARGNALLVWITDLGPSRQVRISDITVLGRGGQ
jgi:serine/threonine protein kinase